MTICDKYCSKYFFPIILEYIFPRVRFFLQFYVQVFGSPDIHSQRPTAPDRWLRSSAIEPTAGGGAGAPSGCIADVAPADAMVSLSSRRVACRRLCVVLCGV